MTNFFGFQIFLDIKMLRGEIDGNSWIFQIICGETMDVLTHTTFEDIQLCTMMTVLDQDYLNIDSELDLFLALARYADKHASENCKFIHFYFLKVRKCFESIFLRSLSPRDMFYPTILLYNI